VRTDPASPWAEPVLEVGAALLAGNGVVLSPPTLEAGERLVAACARSGVPDGLLQVVEPGLEASVLEEACDSLGSTRLARKGTMLVLDGAPMDRVVGGALWSAFARGGQGPAAVGRIIAVPAIADELLTSVMLAARRLCVGDPLDPKTEIGPLASESDLARVDELVREAVEGGAVQVAGGPVEGLDGPFYAPAVLRHVPPDAPLLRETVPGPVLALVEARDESHALELAAAVNDAPISVWAGDRGHGERVARSLGADLTWVNEHGATPPAAPVRLARHSTPRQIASQPTRLRSARWLPYDEKLVQASTSAARLMHGRESERGAALRAGAVPLARVAVRLAREALRR
jgi:acyl-CoA reductase-like NAD-dependent aldehyde dehydrogenase